MGTLLIAIGSFVGFIIAYHTYGRWLARKVFKLDPNAAVPSEQLRDGIDYVPTQKTVVFGHHFTSIAGTGPIVGPAIAIMWGWVPALLWVLFGSIFIGAVHDLGALVVSVRNRGQTVGDIAGRLLNPRVRFLFLFVLLFALWIVLAIFGLVIAGVFKMFPESILPVFLQIPIAVLIGLWLHRKGVGLLLPSLIALAVMYLTVWFGAGCPGTAWEGGALGSAITSINTTLNQWPLWAWTAVLLVYCYIASVLPVWVLLQPRDYINSLQLISTLGLLLLSLIVVAFGGANGQPVEIVAPAVQLNPTNAPPIFPLLFITIACGAISGFHCLVSSGTSSKQLKCESDAQFVGYGSMLTEGFLAVLVILAVAAGIGLGWPNHPTLADQSGSQLWNSIYSDWNSANAGLGVKVGAFVVGSANFLEAMGIHHTMALAIMGVLVASFAGTTLDTATRLQRYVVQELSRAAEERLGTVGRAVRPLQNAHAATFLAVVTAFALAVIPASSTHISLGDAVSGEVPESALSAARDAKVPEESIGAMQAGGTEGFWTWAEVYAGKGGQILWPMFGATNQLLGGLAFLVLLFWLWRRGKPMWFIALPAVFMLIMPAWAMLLQVGTWWQEQNYLLVFIAVVVLALEVWMVIEAILTWPRARGVLEEALPPLPGKELEPAVEGAGSR